MQHLQPNTTLQGGKYRIERVLGQGGFGITYLATHMELQGYVAVKEFFMKDCCLRENDSTVSIPVPSKVPVVTSQQEKFRKEARRLFSLQSEHIVRVYDMFDENNTVYYVMELIDGESLGDKMKSTGMPFEESVVRDYLMQTLDALDEIHRQGYEHLDIKPANLMLNTRGCLKVIDFGASKQMSIDGGPTIDPTACCYTPGYAPSEQEGQFVKKFGPWTDFYALGATLYNMLTNKKPPRYLDVDEEGEDAFVFTPAISSDMRKLILWMMTPRREQRPQKASDIMARLHEHHETEPDTPQTETDDITIIQEAIPPQPAVLQRLIDNMVPVEGGMFMMGRKTKWYEISDNEKPAHKVTLSSFSIGKYEVTQEEWEAVMGNNPSEYKGRKRPVECVSWNDCQEFIRKLNQLTGKQFRLPTEAEWEYAARGGNRSRGYKYSGSDNIGSVAWYEDNSGRETHPVGQKQANELGLYDMSGNVYEWCQDWYGGYSSSSQTNPKGPSSGSDRVFRGGSWDFVGYCRVSRRSSSTPDNRFRNLGLRLAL